MIYGWIVGLLSLTASALAAPVCTMPDGCPFSTEGQGVRCKVFQQFSPEIGSTCTVGCDYTKGTYDGSGSTEFPPLQEAPHGADVFSFECPAIPEYEASCNITATVTTSPADPEVGAGHCVYRGEYAANESAPQRKRRKRR